LHNQNVTTIAEAAPEEANVERPRVGSSKVVPNFQNLMTGMNTMLVS
jgi:hypothetical protein